MRALLAALVVALRCRGRAGARRRRDERVPRHPGVHPRARAVGGRAARAATASTCSRARAAGASSAVSTRRRPRAPCASSFDGRLGAPVQPGVTTTRYALFRAVSTSPSAQAFQPLLGCVPTQGGGGRSTVSAARRDAAGPGARVPLAHRRHRAGRGAVRAGRVQADEQLVGSWHAIAFRTKKAAQRSANASSRHGDASSSAKKVVVTAAAGDGLSIDVHAVVQVGAECAP